MSPLVDLALIGIVPLALVLFFLLPARRAVIATYLVGWLFLPCTGYLIPGLPDYTKQSAASLAVVIGILLFDARSISRFRLKAWDLPIAVWCICPALTSLSNGLGLYNGVAGAVDHFIFWGIPYLAGRLYFRDFDDAKDLALALFLSGLVYAPLCLWEIRMSPQIHRAVYGFHATGWMNEWRFGGWRPEVFLPGGPALSIWMATTSIVGLVLWRMQTLERLAGFRVGWLAAGLLMTFVLCKSVGAAILFFGCSGVFFLNRWFGTKVFLLLLIAAVPLYFTTRIAGRWKGDELVDFAARNISEERSSSLETRLSSEYYMVRKTWKRPWLGWGGWGRNRTENDDGQPVTAVDSLWVQAFSKFGFVGLVSLFAALLLPVWRVFRLLRPDAWRDRAAGAIIALALGLMVYILDKLLNSRPNPAYLMVAACLVGVPLGVLCRPTTNGGPETELLYANSEKSQGGRRAYLEEDVARGFHEIGKLGERNDRTAT